MTKAASRGLAAVLVDVFNWLKIYKQRAFWVQIGATVLAVLLWAPFVSGLPTVGSLVNLVVTMALLCSILTNIVWAGLRKSYSCVMGTIIGFGLFYTAWSAIVPSQDSMPHPLLALLLGFVNGALFGYMAFLVFAISGLIHVPRKRRLGLGSSEESQTESAESKTHDSAS